MKGYKKSNGRSILVDIENEGWYFLTNFGIILAIFYLSIAQIFYVPDATTLGERRKNMGKANQVSAIFCSALGLAVIYGSYQLGQVMPNNPGAGFLSFWCGIVLVGLSLLVFVQGWLAQQPPGRAGSLRKFWAGMKWHKGVYVVLALLLYTLTFSSLGFSLSSMVMLAFLFKVVEPQKQSWSVAIGGAVVTSLLSFLIFARWLDVQLPRGILEKLLF